MTQDTPINREKVERLADFLQDEDLHEEAQRHVATTLLALRAALDEAEAERHRWRQAAAKGSLHTQADLDRAVAEARAVALEEAGAEQDRLVAAFRVNMMRYQPGYTHADFDALIARLEKTDDQD